MKRNIKILPAIAAIALIAGGGYWWYKSTQTNTRPQFLTAKIERGDITSSISSTGKLEAAVFVNVGSQISGTIKKLHVDFNSPVKSGQILALLDRETLEAAMLQARANVSSARARLAQARSQAVLEDTKIATDIAQRKANLDKAESDLKRFSELNRKGYISLQELDLSRETAAVAKAQYDAALGNQVNKAVRESDIAAAKAALEQTEAALHQAEANLDHTIIRSPMNGMVISRSVDEGQTVAASLQTPTLFVIGDLSRMKVNISVDEADIGQVKVGQDAEFTVDAFPERIFKGKVAEIYRAPTLIQNVVTYNTILLIDNRDRLLMPGMTANVSIITARESGVLLAPNSAFRVRMPATDGKDNKNGGRPGQHGKGVKGKPLWVMKGGKSERLVVVTGLSDNSRTEVVSVVPGGGEGAAPPTLNEGDEVVVEVKGGKPGQNAGGSPLRMGGRH